MLVNILICLLKKVENLLFIQQCYFPITNERNGFLD